MLVKHSPLHLHHPELYLTYKHQPAHHARDASQVTLLFIAIIQSCKYLTYKHQPAHHARDASQVTLLFIAIIQSCI